MAVAHKEKKLAASLWDKAQVNLLVGNYPVKLNIKHFSVLGRVDFNQYSVYKNQGGNEVKINPYVNFLVSRNFGKLIVSLGHVLHFDRNSGFQQRVTTVNKSEMTNLYAHSKLWYNYNAFFLSAHFNTLVLSKLNKNYYNVSFGWEQNGVSVGAKFGSKIQEVGEAACRLDKYELSLSKDFAAGGAAAVQVKRDFKDTDKNKIAVCYQHQVNDNLLLKTRIDDNFNIGVFARYAPARNWLLKAALSSNMANKYSSPGFLGQPVDFGLNIEYSPY